MDLSSYKNIYLQTAREYLSKMSASLNKLSGDVLDKEALNDLHISSHSLRSQSQVMGFEDIADLSGAIEKISSNVLQGINQLNNETILSIEKEIGELDGILKQIQDNAGIKV